MKKKTQLKTQKTNNKLRCKSNISILHRMEREQTLQLNIIGMVKANKISLYMLIRDKKNTLKVKNKRLENMNILIYHELHSQK